jgi:anti-anti-sigma regulatory factor
MTTTDEGTVVKLSGRLEGDRVMLLNRTLVRALETGGWVIVDVSRVETLSPEAMEGLGAASAALERTGGGLIIVNPAGPVPRAIAFTRLQAHIESESDHAVSAAERTPAGVGTELW